MYEEEDGYRITSDLPKGVIVEEKPVYVGNEYNGAMSKNLTIAVSDKEIWDCYATPLRKNVEVWRCYKRSPDQPRPWPL